MTSAHLVVLLTAAQLHLGDAGVEIVGRLPPGNSLQRPTLFWSWSHRVVVVTLRHYLDTDWELGMFT